MINLRSTGLTIGAALSVALASGTAHAGAALDDDKAAAVKDPTVEQTPEQLLEAAEGDITYGVGLRLRQVWLPVWLLEHPFVQHATGGASNQGIGVEFTRRRNTFELTLGLEFEHLTVGPGPWLDNNKSIPGDEVDWVQDGGYNGNGKPFGWFTFDVTFINHIPLTKQLFFRYGGGAGLGILTGEVDHIDRHCATADFSSCALGAGGVDTNGGAVIAYNLHTPVFPVITALAGLQFKPTPNVTINLEAGIRPLPFFGLSSAYFF
jgi:opacity protein-like surface antigen